MRLSTFAAPALALFTAAPALAAPPARADVCHATGAGHQLLHVSSHSAHFDPAVHPDDVPPGTFYADADGDGFGDPDRPVYGCPGPGLVANSDDCDDRDPSRTDDCGGFDRLYALVADELVGLDPLTGASSPFVAPGTADLWHLTWDPDRAVFYSLVGRARLVEIDPCTGESSAPMALYVEGSGAPVHFCEGFDYDVGRQRLVATCSLDGTLDQQDFASEAIVEIDPATGAVTVLDTHPDTHQREFDRLTFVGPDARAVDGAGTVASNRLYAVDGDTWATAERVSGGIAYGFVAWDWDNALLYGLGAVDGGPASELRILDPDDWSVESRIGATGLDAYGAPVRGLTFADFTCP